MFVVVALVSLLATPINALAAPGTPTSPSTCTDLCEFRSHVQHVVFLMMENHAYDNYFGDYCLVRGSVCPDVALGLPHSQGVPTCTVQSVGAGAKRCIPFYPENWSTTFVSNGGGHAAATAQHDWANGTMEGFYLGQGLKTSPFGYYNGTTLPLYWDLAEQYALSDHTFSSEMSYSLPNHWYMVAGQSPAAADHNGGQLSYGLSAAVHHLYLNESNATPTVADLLLAHPAVSWHYYDWSLDTYAKAITLFGTPGAQGPESAYNYWNPFAAKYEDYQSTLFPHFVAWGNFFNDSRNGTLPNISWLIPQQYSDHPPANLTRGEATVASVVDAIESSPEWNSTALFISWDDYGGYFDQVPPPMLHGFQYGFRVPLIVVSPYAREDFVSHTVLTFDSVLKLMERAFGLGCLTPMDCGANLPLGMFNFSAPARAPMLLSVNWRNWTYPLPLQNVNRAGGSLPPFYPSADVLSTANDTQED